jgi:hypothetical protein
MFDVVRAGHHAGASKTHCAMGHEFTPSTTRIRSRSGRLSERACLPCERIRHDASYAKRKARILLTEG